MVCYSTHAGSRHDPVVDCGDGQNEPHARVTQSALGRARDPNDESTPNGCSCKHQPPNDPSANVCRAHKRIRAHCWHQQSPPSVSPCGPQLLQLEVSNWLVRCEPSEVIAFGHTGAQLRTFRPAARHVRSSHIYTWASRLQGLQVTLLAAYLIPHIHCHWNSTNSCDAARTGAHR